MIDAQFAAYEARCTKAVATEILPHNKQVLFDAMSAAGIDVVTVAFDSSGDDGQFEAPAGFDAENTEVAIPAGQITVKVVDFETGTIREQTTTPREYIEALACDFLESTHSGWVRLRTRGHARRLSGRSACGAEGCPGERSGIRAL